MKTTTKILTLVSFLSLSFAGVAHAGEGAARRGQVNVQAAAAKAVVAGPAVVKMYSGFSGAQVFVAAASSGTDADCAAAGRTAGTTLSADQIETVTVAAGQVACVASTGARKIELLWHAQPATSAPALMARR
jgi:hypothetical protein